MAKPLLTLVSTMVEGQSTTDKVVVQSASHSFLIAVQKDGSILLDVTPMPKAKEPKVVTIELESSDSAFVAKKVNFMTSFLNSFKRLRMTVK